MVVAKEKSNFPRRTDVAAVLLTFDRTSLLGLLQDFYAANKANQTILHARLKLGQDQLVPYKARISRSICPDLSRDRPISVSEAMKAIAAYKKAIGRPEGLAELSVFYCEEALRFLEACGLKDESYFAAFLRTYDQCLRLVSLLPMTEHDTYLGRIARLETRGRRLGWDVQHEVESLWQAAEFRELALG
jgi:hypothetical protein